MTPPAYLTRADGVRLAYRRLPGNAPTIVFLPGYASDMSGDKAMAVEAWAAARGQAMLRLDYAGCGESDGAFADQTLAGWRDDVLLALDSLTEGPVVLVGSSMGGWLMLLAARARPHRIAGLVGIAAAPDFTDWGFTQEEKVTLMAQGRLERASPHGDAPQVTTRAFWTSGEANRVLARIGDVTAPARLFHGMADADVPWKYAPHIAAQLGSTDVQVTLVKDGGHRLSRDADIALILAGIADLSEPA